MIKIEHQTVFKCLNIEYLMILIREPNVDISNVYLHRGNRVSRLVLLKVRAQIAQPDTQTHATECITMWVVKCITIYNEAEYQWVGLCDCAVIRRCDPRCAGSCYGPSSSECCSRQCVGGCSGPQRSQCYVRLIVVRNLIKHR